MGPIPVSAKRSGEGQKEQILGKTVNFFRRSKRKRRQLERDVKVELLETKTKLKKNIRSSSWWCSISKLCVITIIYFCSSLALTFYQKDLIVSMPYPLSVVLVHLVVKFLLASIVRFVFAGCFSAKEAAAPSLNRNPVETGPSVLPWNVYMKRILLVAFASAWDIGLSQWSLKFVTVALYTMGKTTCILFILFFGVVFNLERKHWSQIVIVLLIGVGIMLFNYKSTSFSLIGFIMIISSSLMCGLRWTLSQLVMQRSTLGLDNPINMMYHVQPLMIMSLLPLAVAIEGVPLASSSFGFRFHSHGEVLHTLVLVTGGGVLAFCMELAEYLIVSVGSSLTLAIIGISKEIVAISISLLRNHVTLSPLNTTGLLVCLSGIVAHVIRKASQQKEEKSSRVSSSFMELDDFRLSESSDGGYDRVPSSMPLLYSDFELSSSEDEALPLTSLAAKKWSAVGDDFFLRENRTWTGVRDSHMESMKDAERTQFSNVTKEDPADKSVNDVSSD